MTLQRRSPEPPSSRNPGHAFRGRGSDERLPARTNGGGGSFHRERLCQFGCDVAGPVDGETRALGEDGSLILNDVDAEDRLAFFIVYEVPEIRPPAVRFAELKVTPNKRVNAFSEILDDGGEAPTRFGVRFPNPSPPRPDDPTLRTVSGKLQNSGTILTQINRLTPGVTYYARPYAENSAGETIGPLKKIRVEEEFEPPSTPRYSGPPSGSNPPGSEPFTGATTIGSFTPSWAGGSPPTSGIRSVVLERRLRLVLDPGHRLSLHRSHRSNNWLYKLAKRNNRNAFWNYSTAMAEMP